MKPVFFPNRLPSRIEAEQAPIGFACRSFRSWFFWIILLLLPAQLILDASKENVICSIISAFFSLIVVWMVVRARFLFDTTLSAFIVLINTLLNFLFPLLFTLIEGRSLVYRLQKPIETFSCLGGSTVVLMASFLCYHYWLRGFRNWGRSITRKNGFFAQPSLGVIAVAAIMGMFSIVYAYIIADTRGVTTGGFEGIVGKICDGFKPFVFAPFLLLFPGFIGGAKKVSIAVYVVTGIWSLMLMVVSLASNVRGIIGIFMFSILLIYLLGLLCGIIDYRKFRLPFKVLCCLGLVLGTIGIGRLATAMELSRADRGQIGKTQMAYNSIGYFFDNDSISSHRIRLGEESAREGWSEAYLLNPVYNRLVSINFNDNVHNLRDWVTPAVTEEMRQFSYDRFWAALPRPILTRLGLYVDKESVYSISNGSYILYITTGDNDGNLKAGAMVPIGIIQFGIWFWPALFVASIMVYFIFDLFADSKFFSVNKGWHWIVGISPVALLLIFSIVTTFQAEAMLDILGIGMRLFFQSVFFYWVINFIFGNRNTSVL